MPLSDHPLSFRISREAKQFLRREAKRQRRSLTFILRDAIDLYKAKVEADDAETERLRREKRAATQAAKVEGHQ